MIVNHSLIDVIIPVYRPDEKLEKLIEKLNHQTRQPNCVWFMQTLVNEEEDARVQKILNKANHAKVIPIPANEFDHGGTRNKGASLSETEYMLFMTQDAVPIDDQLIECLYQSISKDEKIATVYGRQLPDEKVGVVERYTRSFNYPEESYVKSVQDKEKLGIKTYFCSNVCAMYRKEIYEKLGGFVTETIFNEDMIMAAGVIEAGYKIAYSAEAQVVHAHKYTYRQQLTRNFDMAVSQRQYRQIFENVKSESEGIRLVKNSMKHLISLGKWYLIPDLIFQSGFKFIGYKLGLKYEKLPLWFIRKISMNKRYWKDGKR